MMLREIGQRRIAVFLLILIVIQIFLYANLIYSRPFADEGDFITQGWLTSIGGVPYRDFFNIKMPLIHLALSFIFMLFSPGLATARILMIVVSVLQSLLIFFLAKRFFGEATAFVSAAFFIVWSVIFHGFWTTIAPFYSLIATVSIMLTYLYLFEKQKLLYLFLLGFFISLGIFTKQTFLFIPIAIMIYFIIFNNYSKIKIKIGRRHFLAFFVGFLIPAALIFLYFYINNAIWDFVNMTVFYQLSRLESNLLISPLSIRALAVLALFFSFLPFAAFVVYKKFKEDERQKYILILLLLWFVFSFFNALPLRGFSFHLLPVLPAAAILFGFALDSTFKNFNNSRYLLLRFALLAFLLLSFSALILFEFEYTREQHTFLVYEEAVEVVELHTSEQDTIFTFPEMADVYYMTKRKPATYVTFFFDLLGDKQLMDRTVNELALNKPRLIIYFKEKEDSTYSLQIDSFIGQNYALLKKIKLKHPLYNFYNYAFVYEPI